MGKVVQEILTKKGNVFTLYCLAEQQNNSHNNKDTGFWYNQKSYKVTILQKQETEFRMEVGEELNV